MTPEASLAGRAGQRHRVLHLPRWRTSTRSGSRAWPCDRAALATQSRDRRGVRARPRDPVPVGGCVHPHGLAGLTPYRPEGRPVSIPKSIEDAVDEAPRAGHGDATDRGASRPVAEHRAWCVPGARSCSRTRPGEQQDCSTQRAGCGQPRGIETIVGRAGRRSRRRTVGRPEEPRIPTRSTVRSLSSVGLAGSRGTGCSCPSTRRPPLCLGGCALGSAGDAPAPSAGGVLGAVRDAWHLGRVRAADGGVLDGVPGRCGGSSGRST